MQPIRAGSYAVVPPSEQIDALQSFTTQAYVWPTLPGDRPQALLGTWSEETQTGFGLSLDAAGRLELRLGAGADRVSVLHTDTPLATRQWYLVAGSYDSETGIARLLQIPHATHGFHPFSTTRCEGAAGGFSAGPGPILIGAWHAGSDTTRDELAAAGYFDGKIERPRIANRALSDDEIEALATQQPPGSLGEGVVAAWDFSRDVSSVRITDVGPHRLHGECVNLPTRAMTGCNWSGVASDWRQAPQEYGAIHFHHDDLYDCGWESDFEVTLPPELKSGVYAARLRAGDMEFHVPFFVRPPRSGATSRIAFLAPTATYMAYANTFTMVLDPRNEMIGGALTSTNAIDLMQWELPEIGLSTYDHHRDGSGVCYSSRRRPILGMSPTGRLWNFPVDLLIVDWLEHCGLGYDVITDLDLHAEGQALLEPYRVLVTGSHPEYYSLQMLDSVEAWLSRGGRLMYMGGNGFYWRIATHMELDDVIEVRRAEGGIRVWAARAGEYHHSFTGELGGLWRRQRRAPNLLAGVGFISQGFDSGSYYRRRPAANDPRAAFIFDGVDDDILGDFGICLGGAASMEIDCVDPLLGTPAHTLVVASSQRHSNIYELVPEEMFQSHPMTDATQNPDIRADMVFFETPNGGAVFSTGSIGYAGSLGTNAYDNNIARITTNVLKRFAHETPFEMP